MVIEIYNDLFLISSVGLMFAFLFLFEPYTWFIEKFPYKPFSCVLCLSFWCSLLLYAYLGVSPLYAIYTAFIAELSYRKLVM